jgi:futalosine hydrolase
MASLCDHLDKIAEQKSFMEYRINGHSIFPLVTGIGAMHSAFALARFPKIKGIQLAINGGLAGSFSKEFPPGTVVEVIEDRFADLGAEDSDGSLLDTFDLQLADPNLFPFSEGIITNKDRPYHTDLPEVRGITVNKVTGTPLSIALIKDKYPADIETMECAGFLYACRMIDVKCTLIRSISNYVEPRNRDNWQVELALEKLNKTLINFIHVLTKERYV